MNLTAIWAWLTARIEATRTAEGDRGDVPGWVMVTVMTSILVIAILAAFENPIRDAITGAIDNVTNAK